MTGSALYDTNARLQLDFERGEGSWLFNSRGEAYLDFAAGIAVNALGHCHPHLVEALTGQAGRLWHISNLYDIPAQRRLAERLVENSFADKVFFTNSGVEALECAVKTARRYHYVNGAPERFRIVAFQGAFHGRTLTGIAAGGQAKYLEGFGPPVAGFDHIPFGDLDALRAAIGPETAGVLLEPIQGEGGIREASPAFFQELRAICDAHGLLLILDEVQTGVGRTGRLFAHEWAGITPDVMAIAKGIGGGFPVGACLASERAAMGMGAGTHGTTFGGNPLAMAVGNAVLDVVLEDGFLEEVRRKGLLIRQALAGVLDEFPDIFEELRGNGLLLGLKCVAPNRAVNAALIGEKFLAVPAGDNVLRLLPPLTVADDEIREAAERIRRAAGALREQAGRAA